MTLIFNGHSFQYEVECVSKMFFPCVRFGHEQDSTDFNRDDLIITRQKIGKRSVFLLAVVKWNGKLWHAHRVIPLQQADKSTCERLLCIALYEVLTKATGIDVKWGIMTGIRPVKQMNYMTLRGASLPEIRRYFMEDYLVSEQKTKLCELTAKNQLDIIRSSTPRSYSLYVSIPFCPSRCSYCSFVSSSIAYHKARQLIEPYVEKLCEELQYLADQIRGLDLQLESIYIGGGTPTTLTAEQLKRLTDTIKKLFLSPSVREYTIEAGRADTITREKLEVIRDSGATRISINPQTFEDEILQRIGRKHTAQQVRDAYQMAVDMGFSDINMDFIAGLPGDTLEGFSKTMEEAVSLSPSNITVHTLSIKRSSDLYTANGLDESLKQMQTAQMVEYAYQILTKNGYEPYYLYRQKNTLQNLENVGYSKKGYEGLYNIFIMEEVHTILAVGASGVSKLIHPGSVKVKRVFNYKYPYEYLDGFDEILRRKEEVKEFYLKYS
jgi:oxygen-independent coproporphyrinogen-3 oxidase